MFGNRLTSERQMMKLTQEKLAEKLGTTRSNIGSLEKNYNLPSIELLNKCAEFFNCSTDYLLGKTDIRNIYEDWDKKYLIDKNEIKQLEQISSHLSDDVKDNLGFNTFGENNNAINFSMLIDSLYNMNLLEKDKPITEKQMNIIIQFIESNKQLIKFILDAEDKK